MQSKKKKRNSTLKISPSNIRVKVQNALERIVLLLSCSSSYFITTATTAKKKLKILYDLVNNIGSGI